MLVKANTSLGGEVKLVDAQGKEILGVVSFDTDTEIAEVYLMTKCGRIVVTDSKRGKNGKASFKQTKVGMKLKGASLLYKNNAIVTDGLT